MRSFAEAHASGKGEVESNTKRQNKFDAVWSDFMSTSSMDSTLDSGKLSDKELSLPSILFDFVDFGSKGLMLVKYLDESVIKGEVGGASNVGVVVRVCCREGFFPGSSEVSGVVEKDEARVGGEHHDVDGLSNVKLKVAGALRERLEEGDSQSSGDGSLLFLMSGLLVEREMLPPVCVKS
jgi:hypothetical protein